MMLKSGLFSKVTQGDPNKKTLDTSNIKGLSRNNKGT